MAEGIEWYQRDAILETVAGGKSKGRCNRRGDKAYLEGDESGYAGVFLQALGLKIWTPKLEHLEVVS